VDAEVGEPVLVRNATKLLKLGTAHVEWLRSASPRMMMDEEWGRRDSMKPRLRGKGLGSTKSDDTIKQAYLGHGNI
jgi:hypothetical protein